MNKLHIGCGKMIMQGFINLDRVAHPGVDVVFDLEDCALGAPLHFPDNHFDRMLMSHTIEHIVHVLPMMQELHRVAKPDCSLVIVAPYGSSDTADEDPTHVRRIFKNSFIFFSQLPYDNADYGYRGDWDCRLLEFHLDKTILDPDGSDDEHAKAILALRNVCPEILAELRAVKPIRQPGPILTQPKMYFKFR